MEEMFVRTSTVVQIPFEGVVATFCESPGTWLAPVAKSALPDADSLRSSLGLGKRIPLTKSVLIRFGPEASRGEERATLAIRLEATGAKGLFPELDADLTIVPSPHGTATELELQGIYRPPLDGFGEVLDRVALHLVAEKGLQQLVDRIGAALETAATATPPRPATFRSE